MKEKLEKSSPLSQGELFLAKDEERLYVGGPKGNISIPTKKEVDELTAQLEQTDKEIDSLSINIKKFSVIGDGVTDETDLINDVIQYAVNNKFNSLYIPKDLNVAVYNVDIPDNFTIYGGGSLTLARPGHSILRLNNNSRVRDIKFYSNFTNYNNSRLIDVRGKNNIIEGCSFNEGENYISHVGIYLFGTSRNTTIKNNYFTNSVFMIWGEGGAKDIFISGNYFTGGAEKSIVRPNGTFEVEGLGDAIKLSSGGAGRIIIQGNIFVDIYRDCLDCFSLGEEIIFSDNICIDTNILVADIKTTYRNEGDPLGTSNPQNPTKKISIYNNYVRGKTVGTYDQSVFKISHASYRDDGLYQDISYSVHDIQIENNYIDVESVYVIDIRNSRNITVKNNVIRGSFERGIFARLGSENISIENNEIYIGYTPNDVYGIYVDNISKSKISNNNVIGDVESQSNIYPYSIRNCNELQVTGNKANTGEYCIDCLNTKNTSLTNNHLYGANIANIRIYNCEKTIISGNSLLNCERGILLLGKPNKMLITSNSMIDCVTPISNLDFLVDSLVENNSTIGHYQG